MIKGREKAQKAQKKRWPAMGHRGTGMGWVKLLGVAAGSVVILGLEYTYPETLRFVLSLWVWGIVVLVVGTLGYLVFYGLYFSPASRLGRLLVKGRKDEAVELARVLLAKGEDDPCVLINAAVAFHEAGMEREARETFDRVDTGRLNSTLRKYYESWRETIRGGK